MTGHSCRVRGLSVGAGEIGDELPFAQSRCNRKGRFQQPDLGASLLIEQLVAVALRRNSGTHHYEEPSLAHLFGQDEVDRLFSGEHREIFQSWLCQSLERQFAEVSAYVQQLGPKGADDLKFWLCDAELPRMLPPGTSSAQRELFVSDLTTILTLLGS